MINHLFYQNPVTFGDYIFILKKIISSDDFIAVFQNKIGYEIVMKDRFLSKSRSIAIDLTRYRPRHLDMTIDFRAILVSWVPPNSNQYNSSWKRRARTKYRQTNGCRANRHRNKMLQQFLSKNINSTISRQKYPKQQSKYDQINVPVSDMGHFFRDPTRPKIKGSFWAIKANFFLRLKVFSLRLCEFLQYSK
jgi:hypothetical protein